MNEASQIATDSSQKHQDKSSSLLIGVGVLWLILAVALLIYQLNDPAKVEITWETATEQQTVGFNVYRSDKPDEDFVLINEELFIGSMGDPVSGAAYSFIDNDVEAGKTYYYVLEEVENSGSLKRYTDEVFEYPVPGFTLWAVGLTIFSFFIGITMLVVGLKEKNRR